MEPREFPTGTRTAADAASAIGAELGQIVKSLVFIVDGSPVIALVSGANRLDEAKLARSATGSRAVQADAGAARRATGYSIGGVPPFGHVRTLPVYVDEDLLGYDELWAAGGTADVNFAITPVQLVGVTDGKVCELRRDGNA